jgi:hypothetical protein
VGGVFQSCFLPLIVMRRGSPSAFAAGNSTRQ